MSKIQVKFDNTLEQSSIIVPLTNTSPNEVGEENYERNQTEIQQTLVYGIQAPLIMLNNIVVVFSDVISFSLKCKGITPEVSMIVRDRHMLISNLDTPTLDNELRVQILPKFDNKYKKINLTFYVTSIRVDNGIVSVKGEYKLPKFTSSQIKSFGKINTCSLFETIAQEIGLGYATNVEEMTADERWVYCDYKSYKELLSKEIQRSGSENIVFDWWVDMWNNLVLADIYDRYNTIDSDDDMKVWIATMNNEVQMGKSIDSIEVVATLNNQPSMGMNELYVEKYNIVNKPGTSACMGTDNVYSVYDEVNNEYADTLIMDGDVKKDVFSKYEYLGEVYNEYNYLLSTKKREAFLRKITSNETIEVSLRTPLLGIMRGNKVNLAWYVNNSYWDMQRKILKEKGVINEGETNIPMTDYDGSDCGDWKLDRSISGQYLIVGTEMKFNDMNWEYVLTLSRPNAQKPNLINESNE